MIGPNTIIALDKDSPTESMPFRLEFQHVHVSVYYRMTNYSIKCGHAVYQKGFVSQGHHTHLPNIFQFDNLMKSVQQHLHMT